MIVEYIRYQVADPDAFLSAYGRARESLDSSEHCLAYELAVCSEDPTAFILRIEWDSPTGHMHGFRRSPEFGPFLGAIGRFVPDIAEMRHYEVTEIARRKPPAPEPGSDHDDSGENAEGRSE